MAFFAECAARLNACIIEFRRLPDDDRTRTDHENVTANHEPTSTKDRPRWPPACSNPRVEEALDAAVFS